MFAPIPDATTFYEDAIRREAGEGTGAHFTQKGIKTSWIAFPFRLAFPWSSSFGKRTRVTNTEAHGMNKHS